MSAQAPVGQGFTLNASDLRFILQQIRISENHVVNTDADNAPCGALLGDAPDQIPANGVGVTLPWGLRTVDGTCNNLLKDAGTGLDQTKFGAADQFFPRHVPAQFRTTGVADNPATPVNEAGYEPTTIGARTVDPEPRRISNLIVDQTAGNPSAVAAAGTEPDVIDIAPTGAGPEDVFFIANRAPDVGLSAPYNSWFTLFGQFFDHGLDLVNKGGNRAGSVFVPLDTEDPLFVAGGPNFMPLTRATHVNGEAVNQTTPFVDQSQTYTSHPSHQVFLRQYQLVNGQPSLTGRLITGPGDGMATWADVKTQAAAVLGIELTDQDALNIPSVVADPYGHFIPGPTRGAPQLMTASGPVEGDPAAPIPVPADAIKTGHAFLDDIAHNANPAGGTPDADSTVGPTDPLLAPGSPYDDELLDIHFIAGDGRVNENIGLTAVHHIFHSEHNRLVGEIDGMLHDPTQVTAAELAQWTEVSSERANWSYEERLFQAARFVTEMQYQHLAFEEFIRKVQPLVNLFGEGGTGYHTEINPAIRAEFAHAVYRFGHSMLTETVDRTDPTGATDNIDLLDAFLNPTSFFDGTEGPLPEGVTPAERAAGNIVRGMTRQVGNELDEFVTEALRNRLLGLPLDLATLNMSRARDTGIPGLNAARRAFYAESNNTALLPYTSWADLGFNLRHAESLANFIAAYGTHPSIVNAAGLEAKRTAAENLLTIANDSAPALSPELDAYEFLNSLGAYASDPAGITTTGVDAIDLWIGGLAEQQQAFGGLLGATFNYVFENQMENLQDGDRFYYLSRTAGLNLLTQLEGNSFAELISRNTDAQGLPADSFSRPDYVFNVANLGTSGPIPDDLTTPDVVESDFSFLDENDNGQLDLIRQPGGGFRYSGPAHVVFNGRDNDSQPPSAADFIVASEGDDTLRGNGGVDRLEAANGVDNLIGGVGDDFLTDNGVLDDTLKGGHGNDYMSSGQGLGGDLNQGGLGDDFIVGGNDITEHFGGPGNDFVYAGQAEDTVFGDDGDDWEEGGLGPFNLLQGDNGAPFQDDPNEAGHDVMDSDGGEQDFDAEGGDDIMLLGGGIQRSEGMLGFDWATHRGDPSPGNSDMGLTVAALPSVETNRDRFDRVEGLSGWNFHDNLTGDDRATLGAVDPENDLTGHELTAEGVARIDGLAALTGATGFTGGNIILGGDGNDLIEGRGGNDIIDGDRWLNAQLRAPNVATADTTDVTLFDGVGVSFTDATGVHNSLRADVAAGRINPGSISIFRSIVTPPAANTALSKDVAVFSGLEAEYDILENLDGSVTVSHVTPDPTRPDDGTDTLWNVECVRFLNSTLPLGTFGEQAPDCNRDATGTVTISDTTPTENQALTASVSVTDPDGPPSTAFTRIWQAELDPVNEPGIFTPVFTGNTFTPSDGVVGSRLRVVVEFRDRFGLPEAINSAPTAAVAGVNDVPQGAPVITSGADSPLVGLALTVNLGSIVDADGLPSPLTVEWLRGTTVVGTGTSYEPTVDDIGSTLKVRVTYQDLQGTNETLESASTGVVTQPPTAFVAPLATSVAFGTRAQGGTTAPQTLVIKNIGAAALTVGPVTITGANPNAFTQDSSGCANGVLPGGSCNVVVSLNTSAALGAKSATLTLNTNAQDPAVALTGTLVANTPATGNPTINGLPGASVSPVEGQTLTAGPGNIADANGLVGAEITYRWQQSTPGTNTGFTLLTEGPTLTLTNDQVNRTIRLVARVVDNLGTLENPNTTSQVVGDIFVGTALADTWTGTAGLDTASGGAGNDTLSALADRDVISGDGGNDTINAGAGADEIRMNGTGDGFDAVTGGDGNDRIEAMSNGTVIGLQSMATVENVVANGFSGVTIAGSGTANVLNFNAASFTLAGITAINAGGGADNVQGNNVANVINGGAGNDTISGNAGADTVAGDGGNDAIDTANGNDVVILRPGDGTDTVATFDAAGGAGAQDFVNISAFGVTNFNQQVVRAAVAGGTRVTVTTPAGTAIINLNGPAPAAVTAADFVLS